MSTRRRDDTVRLDSHDDWPDEDWPDNVLFADFGRESYYIVADMIRETEADVPKWSNEGHTVIFGPRNELTPEIFTTLAAEAERVERWCADDGDYNGAEVHRAAKIEFENLASRLRESAR